jgi:3-phosphoshikimate 1-carboxyvinyltransferase
MLQALRDFRAKVEISGDSALITPPQEPASGATIECGQAGTLMRFLPPVAALADGRTNFVGDREGSRRPVAPLLDALRSLGADIEGEALPFSVSGGAGFGAVDADARGAACPASGGNGIPRTRSHVSIDSSKSSQFISGLLLSAARFPHGLNLEATGSVPSLPHIEMTVKMLRERGVEVCSEGYSWEVAPGTIGAWSGRIEADLTAATTFLAAALAAGGELTTAWPDDSLQPGEELLEALRAFGARIERKNGKVTVSGAGRIRGARVDLHAISEATPVFAALAALADSPSSITGVGHIKGHETDRLAALEEVLTSVGAKVRATGDGLEIEPGELHGAKVSGYHDHRMVHAEAILGLRVPITIDGAEAVSKTIPDFTERWEGLL